MGCLLEDTLYLNTNDEFNTGVLGWKSIASDKKIKWPLLALKSINKSRNISEPY